MNNLRQIERLTTVEAGVREVKEEMEEMKARQMTFYEDTTKKLDELIALRNKGAGIFWLINAIFTTGLVGALITWWRGF